MWTHVDRGGGKKPEFFVDVINRWPLTGATSVGKYAKLGLRGSSIGNFPVKRLPAYEDIGQIHDGIYMHSILINIHRLTGWNLCKNVLNRVTLT